MQKDAVSRLLLLNLAMLLVSTSGALGRYIDLLPPVTIAYRVLIASIVLLAFCKIKGYSLKIASAKARNRVLIAGVLLGVHWVTYFFALRWGNVAIGMLSMFTYPIFTTFLEPLFLPARIQKVHFLLGMMVLTGIYLLAPEMNLDNSHTRGVLMGLISAVSFAIRNLLLKQQVANVNGSVLMVYQMGIIGVMLFPIALWIQPSFTTVAEQLPYLLLLGVMTTAIGHTLFVHSFQFFPISNVSILSSIQPVFGIIIGMIFLHEIPASQSIIGGLLILSTVIIESYRSMKPELTHR